MDEFHDWPQTQDDELLLWTMEQEREDAERDSPS
jgi:hypothetical protein